MVDGKVGLHGPQLVMLEGRPHALGLLTGAVLGVPVHGFAVVLVTAQRFMSAGKGGQWVKTSWNSLLTSSFHSSAAVYEILMSPEYYTVTSKEVKIYFKN